jgi:formate hydrogenlyase subunit 3/multisubunit Na+/H+ antiporter MnhD subunit
MTTRDKFNLLFLLLTIILFVLNIIISYQENKVEWFRLISNVLLIFLFSMNIYNENKKQKQH